MAFDPFTLVYGRDYLAAKRSGNLRGEVAALDAKIAEGGPFTVGLGRLRTAAMEKLSNATVDQFDVLTKEAALQALRVQKKTSRAASFVTGPRGLEGPLANLIGGGGASTLGR